MAESFEQLLLSLQKAVKDQDHELALSLSEKLQAFTGAQAQTAWIVNISDQTYCVPRSYYTVWVQGKSESEDYRTTRIESVVDHMDMGLGVSGEFNPQTGRRGKLKTVPVPFSAEQIANDIAATLNSGIAPDAFVGVFVSLTPEPSKKELLEAKKKFKAFNEAQVHHADMLWAKKPDYGMIADTARRACQYLGIQRDWYEAKMDYEDCPACATKIRPNLPKCPQCSAILNVEKCLQYGIPVPEHMLPKRKGKHGEAEA